MRRVASARTKVRRHHLSPEAHFSNHFVYVSRKLTTATIPVIQNSRCHENGICLPRPRSTKYKPTPNTNSVITIVTPIRSRRVHGLPLSRSGSDNLDLTQIGR